MQDMESLPALPQHAKYWQAPIKSCKFDWGLLSEAVKAGKADKAKYQYFIFLSSAVRGPFLPPYQMVRLSSATAAQQLPCGARTTSMQPASCSSLSTTKCNLTLTPILQDLPSHWTRAFLQRLHGFTKLVGPTISCEGPALQSVNRTAPLMDIPYVEFGLLATDVVSCQELHEPAWQASALCLLQWQIWSAAAGR